MILYSNPNVVLISVAVVPAIILMVAVYKMDKLEEEPTPLLITLALFGLLAVILAIIVELIGEYLLGISPLSGTAFANFIEYFIIIGFVEEFFKYLMLKAKTWKNPNFNCQFDGVVYAVFVTLGFALFENIGYTFQYGLGTGLMRAVTSIPGHTCFGVFMGIFYGSAKRMFNTGNYGKSKFLRFLAVLVPTLLHGMYDYSASDFENNAVVFIVFTLAMFVVSFIMLKRMAKIDRYIDNSTVV